MIHPLLLHQNKQACKAEFRLKVISTVGEIGSFCATEHNLEAGVLNC